MKLLMTIFAKCNRAMSPWGHKEACSNSRILSGVHVCTNISFLNVHYFFFYLLALSNRQAKVIPKAKQYLVIKSLVLGKLPQLT